jgi:hypothetical protein
MARGTCWEGYEQKGFKKKGSKSVPNCVKVGTMKGDMIKKPVKAYTGAFIDVELDGENYSNNTYKDYYKGMI